MRLTDDSIKQHLQDADAVAPRIGSRGDLAHSVRRRLARRKSTRRGAVACGTIILVVAVFISVNRSRTQIAQKSASNSGMAARQFAAVSIEADLHELTATKLLSATLARKTTVDDVTTPVADVQMQ